MINALIFQTPQADTWGEIEKDYTNLSKLKGLKND